MQHRGLAKLKSTYTDKLPRLLNKATGRVHTSYHQAVTATGRLSSSDPNLQNIPIRTEEGRKIRQAFIARPGYRIVAADYSQIELRIMAHLSEDKGLLEAFAEGRDIHTATAADIIKQAMIDVDAWLAEGEFDALMVMQVHDELVFEVAEKQVEAFIEQVQKRMQGAAALKVPLIVEAESGANWDEAH